MTTFFKVFFYSLVLIAMYSMTSAAQPVLSWYTSNYNGWGVSCHGNANGIIDLTITGGSAPFSIYWSNNETSEDLSNLAAGIYSVLVVDANQDSATADIEITEPAELIIALTSKTEVSCFGGSNGILDITVNGGVQPYGYQWSNMEVTEDLSNLPAGNYSLTVTDANSCTAIFSDSITEPAELIIALTSKTEVSCFGGSNGILDITVNGGVQPYGYQWSNMEVTEDLSNLPAGNYSLTVTDANSCTAIFSDSITEPAELIIALISKTNISCYGWNNGSITINVNGGTQPYSFLWSNGSVSQNLINLVSGSYNLQVTDLNNCIKLFSDSVSQPDSIEIGFMITPAAGGYNGSISADVIGGVPSYDFLWSNNATTPVINNLGPGLYTLTVTDSNACQENKTGNVPVASVCSVAINQVDSVSCFGGTDGAVNISLAGTFPPESFIWSNGSTTQNISGLSAGTYTVTVTDGINCVTSISTSVYQPLQLLVNLTPTQTSCGLTNGSISSSVTGGTGAYSYLWNNGSTNSSINMLGQGSYTVTVTDENNCSTSATTTINASTSPTITIDSIKAVLCNGQSNGAGYITVTNGTSPYGFSWSDGSNAEDLTSVPAGTYTVTVTDFAGCTATGSLSVGQPSVLTVTTNVTHTSCGLNNGEIKATGSGGTGLLSYSWNTGSTASTISNQIAGNYTVTVTDMNGCSLSATATVNPSTSPGINIDSVRNVTCNGFVDGEGYITVTGGITPYGFSWSNGSTAEDLSGVPAGVYIVTVTDNAGCTATTALSITEPSALSLNLNITHTTCGLDNGSITATGSGGTGSLSYLWNTGGSSQTISALAPAAYTITVTDSNLCSLVNTAIVNPSTVPVIHLDSIVNIACFGQVTGKIYISAIGGAGNYSYLWSNSSTNQNLLNVSAGTYTVTVTDIIGCTATSSFLISQPLAALSVNLTVVNSTCGKPNGILTATPAGGTPNYSYLWSNGFTTPSVSGLNAGTYTVTITDVNGCTASKSQLLTTTSLPVISVDSIQAATCFGDSTGGIYISVISGTPGYSFLWSDNSTNEDLTNQQAGNYTVTVTDFVGCTAVAVNSITEPTAIQDSITTISTSCGNSTGSATVWPYGGTGGYSVEWSTGSTAMTIINLAAGSYTVTITDANGCTASSVAIINNIGGPVITIDSVKQVSCFGGSNGAIYTTVTGGTLPYQTLAWSNGVNSPDNIGIPAGSYTLFVIDNNNCLTSVTQNVSQAPALQAAGLITNPTCLNADGSIQVTPSGGTSPYTFLWSDGSGSNPITGILPGVYTVTITDNNGCTLTRSYTLTTSGNPVIVLDSIVNVKCYGQNTGAVYISISSGVSPYQYNWSPGGFSSQDLIGVASGSYTVEVTDNNNCTASALFTINQQSQLSGTIVTTPSTCGLANGTATAIINGGQSPYQSYIWAPGGQVTPVISGLTPGNYTVTVTDANGCTVSASGNVPSTGNPVIQLDTIIHVTCNGLANGGINIHVSGGTPGYTYLWLPVGDTTQNLIGALSGTYTIRVTDALNCFSQKSFTINQPPILKDSVQVSSSTCGNANGSATVFPYGGTSPYSYSWSDGSTGQTISGVIAGNYTVTITDTNGCSKTELAIIPSQPGTVIQSWAVTDVTCNGLSDGSISIQVSGGITPITFFWSPGGQSSQNVSGITAGTYTVTVTDGNLCTSTMSFMVSEPDPLADSLVVTNASCGLNNGAMTVYPFGGNGGYAFQWSNNSQNATINGLAPGVYTVIITDNMGCSRTDSDTVKTPAQLTVLLAGPPVQPLCYGDSNGSLCVSVNGGNPPYSFQWSSGSNQNCANGLPVGNYTVTVTDFNSCSVTQNFVLSQPSILVIDSATVVHSSCNIANGSILIFPAGGTGTYSYQWSSSPSDTLPLLSNLLSGSFSITVTDSNGCTVDSIFTIMDAGSPSIQLSTVTDVNCQGDSTGSITITPVNGTVPYTYLWSNGGTDSTITELVAGNYSVTVTDFNGCTVIDSFTVNEPSALQSLIMINDESCDRTNGSITLQISGGVAPYSYMWSGNISTDSVAFNLSAGIYTVTVTDANGCKIEITDSVSNLAGPVITTSNVQDVSCYGASDGSISVLISGGNGSLQFNWSNGQTTQNITGLSALTYTLIVLDSLGCSDTLNQVISQPDPLELTFVINPASCNLSDGSVSASTSGGTPGYSYLWSTLATGNSITNLSAGNYSVTVTDAHGCSADSTVAVSNPASPDIVSATLNNPLCFGDSTGSIYPVIQGGTSPFSFQWSAGPGFNTQNLLNIPDGVYTLIVTDLNNCTDTATYYITQPNEIIIELDTINATCGVANGQVIANVSGGTGSFTYSWSNGAGNVSVLSGIAAGTYTVTVTDSNNCSKSMTAFVSNIDGPQITVTDSSNVSCPGLNDGSVTVTINGGTLPYNISWTNTAQTDTAITGLAGNTIYTITVSDANSCLSFLSVFISEPEPITANPVLSQLNGNYNISCYEAEDGSILINPQGGTSPYTFAWSNISFNQNLINVPAGNYLLTITDSRNCQDTFNFTLTEPPQLVAQTGSNVLICGIDMDTLRALAPVYGTGTWYSVNSGVVIANPNQPVTEVTNLEFGNNFFYWVVTDGVCYDSAQMVISRNTEIIAIAGTDREICTRTVTLNATPPQFGSGYWQLVSGSGTIQDSTSAHTQVTGLLLGPNVFKWTVVNGSCNDFAPITIIVLPEEACREPLQIPSGFTPNNDGYNDVFYIKGLDDYLDNTLVIYNRWGNKVFEQSPYKNKWKGFNSNNELLPEGTYFYILTIKTTDKTYNGYIDLRR